MKVCKNPVYEIDEPSCTQNCYFYKVMGNEACFRNYCNMIEEKGD